MRAIDVAPGAVITAGLLHDVFGVCTTVTAGPVAGRPICLPRCKAGDERRQNGADSIAAVTRAP